MLRSPLKEIFCRFYCFCSAFIEIFCIKCFLNFFDFYSNNNDFFRLLLLQRLCFISTLRMSFLLFLCVRVWVVRENDVVFFFGWKTYINLILGFPLFYIEYFFLSSFLIKFIGDFVVLSCSILFLTCRVSLSCLAKKIGSAWSFFGGFIVVGK